MKMLTIEIAEKLAESLFWITGRCCREDICVGDVLFHDTKHHVRVVVEEIEVYHKKENVLAHGYVGGVTVRLLGGYILPNSGFLVDAY